MSEAESLRVLHGTSPLGTKAGRRCQEAKLNTRLNGAAWRTGESWPDPSFAARHLGQLLGLPGKPGPHRSSTADFASVLREAPAARSTETLAQAENAWGAPEGTSKGERRPTKAGRQISRAGGQMWLRPSHSDKLCVEKLGSDPSAGTGFDKH